MSKNQAEEKPGKVIVVRTRTILAAVILFTIINFVLLFLMSTHVVTDPPSIAVEYIPKDHLTFEDTFITVDGYVKRYDEASSRERRRLSRTSLHQALVEREIIDRTD